MHVDDQPVWRFKHPTIGDAYAATSRSFDVHLAQLRQKLPAVAITTIRGFGYRLETKLTP